MDVRNGYGNNFNFKPFNERNKMNNKQKYIFENLAGMDWIKSFNAIINTSRDNLFSANHRGRMINQYGFTEAQRVKIEDLI